MIVVLDSYERTRWLAAAMMGRGDEPVDLSEPMAAPAEAPVRA
jgi:hypothetical protein